MFPGMGGGGAMGGENDVTVNINGTSAGLVDALNAIIGQLSLTAKSLTETGSAASTAGATISDSTKVWTDSLKAATEQMNLTTRSMKVLADLSEVLGGAAQADASAWLQASTSATEYGAKLDYVAAQARLAAESQAQLAGTIGGSAAAGGMGGMLGGMLGGEGLMGLMGGLGDAISGAAGKMMGFVQQAGAMVTGLISFSVLNDVIQQVQGFTDSLISLNEQTEKNVFSWKYLYGGMGNAQEIAAWTKQFSMQIPYTRQSLLQAITNLAPMGLSVSGLEHYLPMIADLGATRAPNLDIAQVAQVIMSASMGYTRMLKYDLKINPEELIKYGLDATGRGIGMHINDPTTLLPALENYAKAKGLTGAAKDIAHNTFWGAWSSFIDRIQNFELDTGHGLFASLKTALNDLSTWIDTHSAQISRFSDLIGGTLAGGFKTLTGWIGEFLTGVGDSGLMGGLSTALGLGNAHATGGGSVAHNDTTMGLTTHGGSLLHEGGSGRTRGGKHGAVRGGHVVETPPPPPPPAELTGWQQAGQIIGGALKAIGEGWNSVSQFLSPAVTSAVQDLGGAFKQFGDSLSPDDKQSLKELGGALMAIPWVMLIGFVETLAGIMNALSWAMTNIVHPAEDLEATLGHLKDNIQSWAVGLKIKALTWGEEMIQQFIAGIEAQFPALKAVFDVIGAWIGQTFHIPDLIPDRGNPTHEGGKGHSSARSAAQAINDLFGGGRGHRMAAGWHDGASGHSTVVINASSTVEVLKIIDAMLARRDHGMNISFRSPGGYGAHTFGTIGGLQ